MTTRKDALLGYCATIAFDPRVRAAKSFEAFKTAVLACLKEDLPAVGEQMLKNGAQVLLQKAEPAISSLIGELFQRLGTDVSKKR